MWKIIAWIYRDRISTLQWNSYSEGWCDGVDQERLEPDSTLHHVTDAEWN